MKVRRLNIPPLSFRSRIIATFAVLTVLLVGAFSRLAYLTAREIYLNQLSNELKLLLRAVADQLDTRYLDFLTPARTESEAEQLYRRYLRNKARLFSLNDLFLFNRQGELLVQVSQQSGDLPQPALLIYRQELAALPVGVSLTSLPFKGKDGEWYFWGFLRLSQNHYLGAREGLQRLERIDRLARFFWGIGMAGVLLTILAGWLLARSLSRPVEALVDFSARLGKGDFSAIPPRGLNRELQILADALDRMRRDLANYHRERENMLAQIAHEIRNPLGGIELLTGLLEEDLRRHRLDTEYARKIREEIAGLKDLITAYLHYSRPLQAHPEWLDVTTALRQVIVTVHPQLKERGIRYRLENQVAADIFFDPGHLQQILTNLLHNSLEACSAGDEILLRVRHNKRKLRIEIRDTGCGIAEDIQEKIFQPFFSGRATGTGLGLAICRKLCQENRASIFLADGTPGHCTFVIESEHFRLKGPSA